jgi:hypothetical protein
VIARKEGWLSARVGDEIMMMSVDRGEYIGMNDVGARIWELIETPSDVATICAALLREFEVSPETCETQVRSFVSEMEKHGTVTVYTI